jgi:branched-chain amino acid transport system permease protein
MIGISIVAMQGLNILFGYTGQISVGHSAFIGAGAYASAILSTRLGFPFIASFICAGIICALIGLIFALPSVRVKGFYLAITTLGAYFIIIWVIQHWTKLTSGIWGLSVPGASIFGISLHTEKRFYIFTLIIVLLSTFTAKNIVRSHVGRGLVAIRDNDLAASVMGINVFHYKLLAFFICCFYAGIAGSMWAHYIKSIHPEQFPFFDSIWYLGFLAVGGMGSIMGPIFGTVVWRLLREAVAGLVPFLSSKFPAFAATAYSGLSLIIFGLIIVIFLIFEPRGINHRWTIFKSYYRMWPFSY